MQAVNVLRSNKLPFEAVLTPKSGSRFLMNLVYYLDTRDYYPELQKVAQSEDLKWAKAKPLREGQRSIRVAIVRHPENRFCALYFENVFAKRNLPENWLKRLKQMSFNFDANDLASHQKNASILLDFIQEKVKEHGLFSVSDLIAPQVKFVLPAQNLGFEPIIFARANIVLAERLERHLENAQVVTTHIMEGLHCAWPFAKREFVNGSLAKRIRQIYAIDLDYFEAVRYGAT